MLKSKGSVSRIRRKMEAKLIIIVLLNNHIQGKERWMNLSEAFTFYNKVVKLLSPYISCTILAQFSSQIQFTYIYVTIYRKCTTLLLVHNNFQLDCINQTGYIMIYQIWVIVWKGAPKFMTSITFMRYVAATFNAWIFLFRKYKILYLLNDIHSLIKINKNNTP